MATQLKRLIEISVDATKAQSGGQQVEKSLEGVRKRASDARVEVTKFDEALDKTGTSGAKLSSTLGAVFGGISAGLTVRYVTKEMTEFEDAMIGIQNTVGASGKELDDLGDRILQLSTRIPTSVASLGSLIETAHQLGIEGNDGLADFADAIERIGAVTDLKGASGARSLGQLLKLSDVDVTTQSILRLGSAVDTLGDAFGGSESQIVSTATSIQALVGRFDVSAEQSAALAAALNRLGVQGGQSASTISKLFETLSDEFVASFGGSKIDAFQGLLKGLKDIRDAGGDVEAVLDNLGFANQRGLKTILPLIKGNEDIAKALALVKDQAGNLQGTIDGSNRVFGSLSSQMSLLGNNIQAIVQGLTRELTPAFVEVVEYLNDFLRSLVITADGATRLTDSGKAVAVILGVVGSAAAYVVAVPIVGYFGSVATAASSVASTLTTALIPGLTIVGGLLSSLLTFEIGNYFYKNFRIVADTVDIAVNNVQKGLEYVKSSFQIATAYVSDIWQDLFNNVLRKPVAEYIAYFADGLQELESITGANLGGQALSKYATELGKPGKDANPAGLSNTYDDVIKKRDAELALLDESLQSILKKNAEEYDKGGAFDGEKYGSNFGDGLLGILDPIKASLKKTSDEIAKSLAPVQMALSDENVHTEGATNAANAVKLLADSMGKANKEADKEAAIALKRKLQLDAMSESIDRQIGLYSKSSFEREHATEIIKFQTLAEEVYGDKTKAAEEATGEFVQKLRQLEEVQRLQQLFDDLGDSVGNAFEAMFFEAKSFSDAIQGLLKDIARQIFQQTVTRPLSGAISGGLSSIFLPAANGMAFDGGNVVPFASGGIVSSPTSFGLSGGRTGLMGEAGPEAILPLRRGADGKLGVTSAQGSSRQVVVNFNVTTPNVADFRRSQSQISRELRRSLKGAS